MSETERTNPAVLISYRRADSQNLTERVGELMAAEWGTDSVFIDTDDIPYGTQFDEHIRASLEASTVVLAMIGREYLCTSPGGDQPRLFEPNDFVRRELEWAKENSIPILPVLLDGARMPPKEKLPESVQFITDLNAVQVRPGADFMFTSYRLLTHLQDHHDFPKPHEKFPWEYVVCPLSIFLTILGVVNSVILSIGVLIPGLQTFDTSTWVSRLVFLELFGPLLLGAGPLGIVIAKRWCCLRQARGRRSRFLDGLEEPKIKEPNAMLGFAIGVASLGWGLLSAVPALFFSITGLIRIRKSPSVFRGMRYATLGILIALFGSFISFQVQSEAWNTFSGFRSLNRAASLYESGAYDRAESEALNACERLPSLTAPYLVVAKVFVAKGNYQDGIDASNIVIDDLEATRSAMNPSVRMNDAMLERAAEQGSMLAAAYRLRATAHRSLGQTFAAESDEQRAQTVSAEIKQKRRTGRLKRSGVDSSVPIEEAPPAPASDEEDAAPAASTPDESSA